MPKPKEPVIFAALDTLKMGKQALVFVNSKPSAEKVAEDIAKELTSKVELDKLANTIENALSKPTKQCTKLAECIKKGIAFHHSGLAGKQRELIEDSFRAGTVKIICCTPTLAAGIDMPAFRAIIRDLKRFGNHGMANIPVLEFLQMAGRAGRPKYDTFGEALVIAKTDAEKEFIIEHYIHGEPEEIYSKLAVEPVLRTYVLSLVNSRVVNSDETILDFFSKTFWAHQYQDMGRIEGILDRTIEILTEWGFLQEIDKKYRATMLGKRVAELYLDPLTANFLLESLKKTAGKEVSALAFLQLVSNTLEMRPLLRVKQKEFDDIQEKAIAISNQLLSSEPNMFEPEYNDWISSIKTAFMLDDWINEKDEEWILEHFDCRPGEIRTKIDNADWLLYSCHELAKIMQYQNILNEIMKIRLRLKYGVKEELLTLIRLEGIGRVRARMMNKFGIKTLGDLRKVSFEELSRILGKAVAEKVKVQVGEQGIKTE